MFFFLNRVYVVSVWLWSQCGSGLSLVLVSVWFWSHCSLLSPQVDIWSLGITCIEMGKPQLSSCTVPIVPRRLGSYMYM